MKPAPFRYHDPATTDEALALYGSLDNARVLAGGQSLMPMMNFRFAQPDHLVDLNKIAALSGIRTDPNALKFGAMTRQRAIETSPEVAERCPILVEALGNVGHRQTRNRGTIGGSLCHLDPSAELLNCAMLHDGAVVEVGSARGRREIAVRDFPVGYMTHSLAEDEILLGVVLPAWSPAHGYAFREVARRHGDFAVAAVSALVELDRSGAIERAALCASGASPVPIRPAAAERLLVGQRGGAELYRAAADAIEIADPIEDAYATAEYRGNLVRVLTERALEAAVARAERAAHV